MSLVGRTFALTNSKIPYYDKLVVANTDGALFEDANHVQYNQITVYQNGTRDYYKASNSSRVNVFYCNWDDTCGWNDPAYKTITFLADPDSINIGTSPYLTTLDDFKEWLGTYSDEVLPVPYLTNDQELTSIANAIREKGGTSASLAFPAGFVSAIGDIPTGGGIVEEKDVNFIDYDGTLLYSYTSQEAQALTELPTNPTHTGLTSQGWNWTLAQIKSQLTNVGGKVWVGQMYVTTSGNTEIDVEMKPGRLTPYLTIAVNGTVSVDWGDDTTPSTVTGTSLSTKKYAGPHTYASSGNYTIKISVDSGSFAFLGGSNYTLLRKNTTSTQNYVYSNCVKAIRIGTGITTVGSYAFANCQSLSSVTFSSGITSIADYAFYHCYSIKGITLSNNITSIAELAFSACRSLLYVSIPNGVTSIDKYAFYTCTALTGLTIPNSITSIGNYAFYTCNTLKGNISIPNSVTSLGTDVFNTCYTITSVTIPSSITSIGDETFYDCTSLANISIPNNITIIGSYAFYDCLTLTKLTIPSGVTSIGDYAFSNCYGIKEYHIQPTSVPTAGTTIFKNIVSDAIIYVPYSSDHSILEAYKTASNWSTYASYMQEEPQS